MPDGDVPGVVELPEFPGVEGEPGLLVDPPVAPGVPGKVPHGEPVGLFPGFVFGFTVEGVVLVPGVDGLVEFAPGTVDGTVEFPGGVEVFPGVDAPGVWLCPGVTEPDGDEPPAGALCATTQAAHVRSMKRKVSLVADIQEPPGLRFDPFHRTRSRNPYANCAATHDGLTSDRCGRPPRTIW
ncbi:MAG: hypothetical protein WB566_14895 [Terriglobales bacterium]